MNMLDKIDIFKWRREKIYLVQDKQGNWEIGERIQLESDIIHNEPLYIHIGFPHEKDIHIDETTKGISPTLGLIWMGEENKKRLLDILQTIVEEEKHREIIILWEISSSSIEKKNATLGDFAHILIEETKQDIFLITNTLEKREDIDLKIEENKIYNQKQAKHYHKFHNQKPRGPQGQYAKRGRK